MVIFGRAIWDVEQSWENSMRGREVSEFGKQVVFYWGKLVYLKIRFYMNDSKMDISKLDENVS